MPRVLRASLRLALLLALVAAAGGAAVTPAERTEMVTAHNVVRADFGTAGRPPFPLPYLPPVAWSAALETTAQAHASLCGYGHSGTPGVGENIFASTPGHASPTAVVASWASEVAFYSYPTNGCSAPNPPGTCGHYTQIVWRTSTQIGCGVADCSEATSPFPPPFDDDPWTFWVCQYSPPGNFVGQRPFLCDYDGNGSTESVCDLRVVFTDGFEWGSTLAWSDTVP